MNRSPSAWLTLLVLLVLLPLLVLIAALPGAAGAEAGPMRGIYRPSEYGWLGPRGCVLPMDVPRFDAIALHAPTPGHAESLATRLGFLLVLRGSGGNWRVSVPMGANGCGLLWRDAQRDPGFEARGVFAPVPLQTLSFTPADPELPLGYGRVTDPAVDPQPNGVTGIAYMIALVRSIGGTAGHWPPAHTLETGGGVPLLDFRSPYRVATLGARACDAPAAGWGGGVRLLEPDGTNGFARERLDRSGAGWLGFGLNTSDVERTAAWFDAHGVRYRRDGVAGRPTLRLDPAETDGWLVEVVGPAGLPTP